MEPFMEEKQKGNLLYKTDPDSERIERKVILSMGQSYFFTHALFSSGFKERYTMRKITSIYFDDINLNALRDNIDGNWNRNKIRTRYYNDEISQSSIEIKQKRGLLGYKWRIPFDNKRIESLSEIILHTSSWCKVNLEKEFFPTSRISYNRVYLENQNFRATIDRDINSFRLSSSGRRMTKSIHDYEVLEFKYRKEHDSSFRKFFLNFNSRYIRATKSSKYSNSMMY